MASEGEHVDADVAENLINAAKEALLEEPQAPSAQESSPAPEFIQNVAHIALDKSNDAADSSKAYIESVVHEVQDYAQNAATGSTSNAQQTLSKAVHVQAYPRSATGDASSSTSDGGLLTSVATWCSSLCGSKNNAAGGEPRSVDLRAEAENVAGVLHSSTTATTSSPVETPSPHDDVVTPAPASEPTASE